MGLRRQPLREGEDQEDKMLKYSKQNPIQNTNTRRARRTWDEEDTGGGGGGGGTGYRHPYIYRGIHLDRYMPPPSPYPNPTKVTKEMRSFRELRLLITGG